MTKVVQVDWSGGGDFCGNSTSGSTWTERSEGEGWSRAREKRPPEWKSTASKKKRVQEISFLYSLSYAKRTYSVPSKKSERFFLSFILQNYI